MHGTCVLSHSGPCEKRVCVCVQPMRLDKQFCTSLENVIRCLSHGDEKEDGCLLVCYTV
jgi:hypothetical protein